MKNILIYQKPNDYFFPNLPVDVYAPYEHKEGTFIYYIYRVLNLLNLPFSSFFWGAWKKEIQDTEKVIIFDYGYQNGMEKYIKRKNPHCEVYLFCWNKINKLYPAQKNFSIKDNIYSTDPTDCLQYGLKYNHSFCVPIQNSKCRVDSKNRILFLGSDRGRGEYISYLKTIMETIGVICDIRISRDAYSA